MKAQGSGLDAGWCGGARQDLEHHWKAADAADMSVKTRSQRTSRYEGKLSILPKATTKKTLGDSEKMLAAAKNLRENREYH